MWFSEGCARAWKEGDFEEGVFGAFGVLCRRKPPRSMRRLFCLANSDRRALPIFLEYSCSASRKCGLATVQQRRHSAVVRPARIWQAGTKTCEPGNHLDALDGSCSMGPLSRRRALYQLSALEGVVLQVRLRSPSIVAGDPGFCWH